MKNACCEWCNAIVKVRDTFDEMRHRVVCSIVCKEAELLFQQHYCDEEINRREHYRVLTKGEDDGS